MDIKTTKYMVFEEIERKPKTSVWQVLNRKSSYVLGLIEYYTGWRQYVFEPSGNTEFNNSCLNEISGFLTELNNNRQTGANYAARRFLV